MLLSSRRRRIFSAYGRPYVLVGNCPEFRPHCTVGHDILPKQPDGVVFSHNIKSYSMRVYMILPHGG